MLPIRLFRMELSEIFAFIIALPLASHIANYYGGPGLVMVVAATFGWAAGYLTASRRGGSNEH